MRVIAGSARRIQLQTPVGMETRPTTDRIKETLFNMIQPQLCDCQFLDLFSGSGAIGIEALSRGAKNAVFVEQGAEAMRCIEENLQCTKLAERSKLLKMDVFAALQHLQGTSDKFDIIFMDPPYGYEWEKKVLERLKSMDILDEDTDIIFEAALDTDISYLEDLGYMVNKVKKYKTNMHVFVSRMDA